MENRATTLLRAALADAKIQLKKGDYQTIADRTSLTQRTVRDYISNDTVRDCDTAKAILVAAKEIIKQREADAENLVESCNLIKE
jgi:hypothetical protein